MAVAGAQSHQSKIYDDLSHLYDRIFTRVFYPRIRDTLAALNIPPGARVLEVGVGTGLALSAYPEHAQVTGIDLSAEMLEIAQQKVTQSGWRHITLQQMDAQSMTFPDEHFDYVTAFHVVSVVPEPRRLMNEMHRVCRRGGTLAIINHFRSERPWLAPVVDFLDPITRKAGWSTRLRFDDVFRGVPVKVERRYKTSPRSLFTIAVATRE